MFSFAATRIFLLLALLSFGNGYTFHAKDSVKYYLEESKKNIYTDFSKAKLYLEKADILAQKSKDKNLIADVAHNYGGTYYNLGSFDIAMKKFMQALAIYQSTNNKLGISKCLMGQGLVQQGIERNEEAIKLFKRAIVLNNEIGNTILLSKNILNIAISEEELKEYESAYKNFIRAYKMSISNKDFEMQHLSLNKLGNIHFLRNDLDSSVYYYKKLLLHADKPNNWELSFAYTGLSQAFFSKGNFKLAEKYGIQGFELAKSADAKWDMARASGILSDVFIKSGKPEEAYKYLKINKEYNDSLFSESKLQQINLLQLNNKEAENEKLSTLNDISKQKLKYGRILVVSMVLVLFFLLVIIFQYYRNSKVKQKLYEELELKNIDIQQRKVQIKKQNKTLSDLNQTKNKLFSILSHDLKSPIASIQQVIEMLKYEGVSNDEMKIISEHLMMQVDSTSRLLNNLLHWSMTQLDGAKINMEDLFLEEILKDTVGAMILMIDNKQIEMINYQSDTNKKIHADIGHVRVILNNLLSNAIKFTPEKGTIEIQYSEGNKMLNLHIINSGSEISPEKIEEILNFDKRLISEKGTVLEEGTGLGLLLVKQFLSDNNGKLRILNSPKGGTEFIVSFQKAK